MHVTLEDTKKWLRVDGSDDDEVITHMILSSEELVAIVLRKPLDTVETPFPEAIKHAIYYATSRVYEERNELDVRDLIDVLKSLLIAFRKVEW